MLPGKFAREVADAAASGVEVADILERARPSSWHWEMRQAMGNRLACSGRRGADGRCRNWSENLVGAERFELAIAAAWRQREDDAWGKRERRERRLCMRGHCED